MVWNRSPQGLELGKIIVKERCVVVKLTRFSVPKLLMELKKFWKMFLRPMLTLYESYLSVSICYNPYFVHLLFNSSSLICVLHYYSFIYIVLHFYQPFQLIIFSLKFFNNSSSRIFFVRSKSTHSVIQPLPKEL